MSFDYESCLLQAGLGPVAGADEAGRGACAGPMVAAAVVLDADTVIPGLTDSKKLTPAKRARLYDEICEVALAWSVVEISPGECDALGMHEADLQGLRRALLRLDPAPAYALTDGFAVPGLPFPSVAVWKGDQVAACVSAASIIAKVTRDRIMVELDEEYPAYDFRGHKGYCTKIHQERLEEYGPSAIHRLSYANVARTIRSGTPSGEGVGAQSTLK